MTPTELDDEIDAAYLLARSRGESATHPDPARAAAYERLERALAALPCPDWPRKLA